MPNYRRYPSRFARRRPWLSKAKNPAPLLRPGADARLKKIFSRIGAPPAAPTADRLTCYVTDRPESFETVASRFLGEPLGVVHQTDIA